MMTMRILEWRALTLFLAATTLAGCAAVQAPNTLVQMEIEASNDKVLANNTSEGVVHIDIGAQLPPNLRERIPLNISLVMDHSGSMSGDQMADAKAAVIHILNGLHPDDKVSVIAFSTRVAVLQPQEAWGDVDTQTLFEALGGIRPRGTTALHEALQQALAQVRKTHSETSINRVFLLSDGIPNEGSRLGALAQQSRAQQVAISTFGLGPYYNEDLMAELADVSGGNYHFIKESEEIETFLMAEKRSMEQVVARGVQLRAHLGPGVQVLQAFGGKSTIQGKVVSIFVGDIGAAERRQVALKLKITAPASGAKVELMDVELSWEDVVTWTGAAQQWQYLEASATRDRALIDGRHKKSVEEKVGRLQAAWEMEAAMDAFEAGNKEAAERRLREAVTDYRQKRLQTPRSLDRPSPLEEVMLQTAEMVADTDAKSETGKLLIKKTKRRSREASGR